MFETLEARVLFTKMIPGGEGVLGNGRLSFRGTEGPDQIVLKIKGEDLVVRLNGQAQRYPSAEVHSIEVGAGAGADVVDASGLAMGVTVHGGAGDDTLTGSGGSDVLYGDEGEDVINGRGGADTIRGGAGNDVIRGGNQADLLIGGAGHDTLSGGAKADTLRGGKGDDFLVSGNLQGQAQRDGADVLQGGPGYNMAIPDDSSDQQTDITNVLGSDTATIPVELRADQLTVSFSRQGDTTRAILSVAVPATWTLDLGQVTQDGSVLTLTAAAFRSRIPDHADDVLMTPQTVDLGALADGQYTLNLTSRGGTPLVSQTFSVPTPTTGAMRVMDTSSVVEANNQFAFGLYAKLGQEDGNLFFSPYSISTALAMAYAGASGTTAEQMGQVLHLPSDGDPHAALGALMAKLQSAEGSQYEMDVANALWGQEGFGFLDSFLNTLNSNYGAGLRQVGYMGDAEGSRQTINDWVEQQTHNRIQDLMPAGSITAATRLVLTNAIYFNGTWQQQFDPSRTSNQAFYLSDGGSADVPMMHQTTSFKYYRGDGYQVLELPYEGDKLSMLVVLPDQADGLSTLERQITPEMVSNWAGQMGYSEVQVTLPKFKLEQQFDLAAVLKSMGMSAAFDPLSADFSGMDGRRDLSISAVVHKAFVQVNEQGTEASGATGIAVGTTAVQDSAVFDADHPFLFMIRDNATGSIPFMGRVSDPRG